MLTVSPLPLVKPQSSRSPIHHSCESAELYLCPPYTDSIGRNPCTAKATMEQTVYCRLEGFHCPVSDAKMAQCRVMRGLGNLTIARLHP